MAGPAVFSDGLVTAGWGASGEDRYHLTNGGDPTPKTGVCFDEFSLSVSAQSADITQFTTSPATAMAMIQGLYEWEATLSGFWPRVTQKLGNSGGITYASGYTTNVTSWELTVDVETHRWVPMSGAAVATPYFRPGRVSFSGRYTALVDLTTAISALPAGGDTGAAATFKLCEDAAADPSFTCSIIPTGYSVGVRKGSMTEVTYDFTGTGALTVVAGTNIPNILPAGTVDPIDWDNGANGIPDGTLVLQAASGRTFTGIAFIKRINVRVDPSTPIAVSVTAQGAGALAIA